MARWESAPPLASAPAWQSAPPAGSRWREAPPMLAPNQPPTGVPSADAAIAAQAAAPRPPAPGLGDKVVGGLQAAMQVATDTIDSIGGLFGGAAGGLGAALGAIQTKLTGGVQPDDPRVLAAGSTPYHSDAIAEGAQQGAQQVVGALHSGPSFALSNPQGQEYAHNIEEGVQTAANALGPVASDVAFLARPAAASAQAVAPMLATRGAQAAGAVSRGAAAAADAVSPANLISKALPAADPELAGIAQLADQFPHPMTIPPDRLLAPGVAKSVGQDLGDVSLGGGGALASANKQAFTRNLINLIDPGSDATRLTEQTLNDALNRAGAEIGESYKQAGAIPATDIEAALQPVIKQAQEQAAGNAPTLVQNRVSEILGKADEDGNLSPQALREFDSDLGRQLRTLRGGDAEASDYIRDVQGAIRDTVESQLTPEEATDLQAARRRYAYGVMLEPSVAKRGAAPLVDLSGLADPGSLIRAITSTKRSAEMMANGRGGPIGDLARVGQLLDNTAPAAASGPGQLVTDALHTAVYPARVAAAQVYNRAAPEVTQRMLAPYAPVPPAPPPELELAPPGAGPQPPAPPGAGPLGDLTPDWSTTPGAGGGAAVPAIDATDLHPAIGEAPVTTGNRAPPSAGQPGAQIPAVPGRPDLPDVLVSGPPAETAATPAANAAMAEPGTVAARAAQAESAAAPPAPPAGPQPNAAEQAKLDEIDKLAAGTQSDIVRQTLERERARVLKDVANRDTVEKAQAAAAELRQAAETVQDPTTKAAMLTRAEKLDPTPPEPEETPAKPEAQPLPSIEYADTAEWRQAHGLGPEDAQRAILTRRAYDLDPDAVEFAAVQHGSSPRAFDRVIDSILEQHHANETASPAGSSQGAQAGGSQEGSAGGESPAAGDRPLGVQRGAVSGQGTGQPAAQAAAGPGAQAGRGQAAHAQGSGAALEQGTHAQNAGPAIGAQPAHGATPAAQGTTPDAIDAAVAKARFERDHPRASDGTFVPKD